MNYKINEGITMSNKNTNNINEVTTKMVRNYGFIAENIWPAMRAIAKEYDYNIDAVDNKIEMKAGDLLTFLTAGCMIGVRTLLHRIADGWIDIDDVCKDNKSEN
ncbi:MAG: hypothetical protein ACTSUP_03030 [Candidatus Heimdallarchaeaceae archaeon]